MSKCFILALLSCALLFGGDKKPPSNAQAAARCLEGCAKRLETCKKNAKTPRDLTACTQSNGSCRSACSK